MKTSALLLAALVCLWAQPTHAGGHSAIDPSPRPDAWWKERHESMNKKVAELGSRSKVIFIGDSITQGWEGDGKDVWARYYAQRDAINLGIGGDRTQHVLWRLDNGNLNGISPKAAVVMIGTNNSNGEDNSPGQIVDGVRAIIDKLRAKLPETKILLLAIFPRAENFSVQRGKLAQINQVLRRVADEKNVFWIDFGHKFLNDDGTMPRELMPDYLHLSPKGYAIWAESIEEPLARILGDKPVAGAGDGAGTNLTGKWLFTLPGPDGQPVTLPIELTQSGSALTGRVKRGEGDAWLPIENGKVEGNSFSWRVKRDRSDGTTMVYDVTGAVAGAGLAGKVKTDLNGNEMKVDWSAKRN